METLNGRPDEATRQAKEDLLRAHFGAVRQLTATYLIDRERTETAVKNVFKRAFGCLDDGENPVDVALQLHGFTLEEVLRFKALEPPLAMDYYSSPQYYQNSQYPPNQPYPPYQPSYTPYSPQYAPPYAPAYGQPYAPPQFAPPYAPAYGQPYAPPPQYAQGQYPPPQYAQGQYPPPQGQSAPQYAPPYAQAPGADNQEAARADAIIRDQQRSQRAADEKRAAQAARKEAERIAAQERRAAEEAAKAEEEARLAAEKAAEEAEDKLGPAPYEGPAEDESDEQLEPHEPTMTPEMEMRRAKRARNARIVFVLNIIGLAIMGWVVLGLLRRIGVLPQIDFGYSWFNENLFRMF